MASSSSSSSSSPRNWRFNVFTSFHGPDVRQGFLSHLRKQFDHYGITMFNDQEMERGDIISPALIEAIRNSRIAIVLLSKNYASSSWCLDELLEILECKDKVRTIFYGVDPSHVRHQTGDFGMAFNKTCDRKKEHRRKWSEALTYVGNIAGEDFKNGDNEANKIEKIARDISDKLNDTPSRDFDDMVGLEGHLTEIKSLLDLDDVGVKMVAISGPAGIGKSTIARALHSKLYRKFQHNCFVDNHWVDFKNFVLGAHGLKLGLHEKILSKMLNQNGIQINHSGVIERRLNDKKVLLTLDDVGSLDQLEAVANIEWFGPGSRVIVTTENKGILPQHDITDIYEVKFPSEGEARQIFCLAAFKKPSPPNEFINLVDEVASICGNLPLVLHVMGSALRGMSKADWIKRLPSLRSSLDGRIDSVLKVGYESLDEQHQDLFLLTAVFFNYEIIDKVISILLNTNRLDVSVGLENLANRYLIHIYHIYGVSRVEIHQLLEVMARRVISKQDPLKRQILVNAKEICEVLEFPTVNRYIVGVSFYAAEVDKVIIHPKAFEGMHNLSILKVEYGYFNMGQFHIPEEMEFPRRIRLFHWDAYPGKSLHRLCPENLVELRMKYSELEKLWEGRQPLANLKWMDLSSSSGLKEIPDLTNATNLESLVLSRCTALVELPSSIVNLHKLHRLCVDHCESLEVIPSLANLTSLVKIKMKGCSQLRSFPDITTNTESIEVKDSGVEELPASLMHCPRLEFLDLSGNKKLKTFSTHLPTSVTSLNLRDCGLEKITDCIKGLQNLKQLDLSGLERLESLPELPSSLRKLRTCDCESLERVSGNLSTPMAKLDFTNCLKLDGHAQRTIIQQLYVCRRGLAFLPGREVPSEFSHRARGNSLTIPHSAFKRFKVCVVISYTLDAMDYICSIGRAPLLLRFDIKVKGYKVKHYSRAVYTGTENAILFQGTKHLIIFDSELPFLDSSEVSREIKLEFRNRHQKFSIIECGVQILSVETDRSNYSGLEDRFESGEASTEEEDDETEVSKYWGIEDIYESSEASTEEEDDETDGSNNGGLGDIFEPKASDEPEEDDDSIIAKERSETKFSDVCNKEDNEEGYKSYYGDKDKDIVDEATNGQKEDSDENDDEGYKSKYGEASEDKDKDIADEGDYKFIARKCPITTVISHLFSIFFITVFVFYVVLFCL